MRMRVWLLVTAGVSAVVSAAITMYVTAHEMNQRHAEAISYLNAQHSVAIQSECGDIAAKLTGEQRGSSRTTSLMYQCMHNFGLHTFPNGEPVPVR